MNARILTFITATLVALGGALNAGEISGSSFSGSWAGYDTEKNSGVTGGSIDLTISPAESERYANVSGMIQVPLIRLHGNETVSTPIYREITGRVNLRTGAIAARCEKGIVRGHLAKNGHGVVGRLRVNSGRFIIRGAYFADGNFSKGQID